MPAADSEIFSTKLKYLITISYAVHLSLFLFASMANMCVSIWPHKEVVATFHEGSSKMKAH
eukprot:192819-Chlamydomonas_euryale.AAC.2